jgi:hypothetical protein
VGDSRVSTGSLEQPAALEEDPGYARIVEDQVCFIYLFVWFLQQPSHSLVARQSIVGMAGVSHSSIKNAGDRAVQ